MKKYLCMNRTRTLSTLVVSGSMILITFLSVVMMTGCTSLQKTVDGMNMKVNKSKNVKKATIPDIFQEKEKIQYTYSKDKQNVVIMLSQSSADTQAAIMQEMKSKGYSLQAVDTIFSESYNSNPASEEIQMYFQKSLTK